MENVDGDFNSTFNNPLPPEFAHWPLDMYLDDDEFRAGYPFSPVQEMEFNDSSGSYSSTSTPDTNISQSKISGDDGCISPTKDNDELNDSSSEQQKKKVDALLESNLMNERVENHEIDAIQQNSYNDEQVDGHQQNNIAKKVDDMNTGNFERLDDAKPSHYVVLN